MAFKRAIVTAVGPLRILIDGDTVAIPFTPKSLIDPATLTVGDVVHADQSGHRLVVLGRSGGLGLVSGRNLIINGDFRINQREYVSGASTTSNQYTLDRWYTRIETGTFAFTAAPQGQPVAIGVPGFERYFAQVIERENFQTGTHVVSWEGTAKGAIFDKGGSAVSYNSSPFTFTSSGTADTVLEFAGEADTVWNVKVERGSVPTPFATSPIGQELALCQRYYWRMKQDGGYATVGTGAFWQQGDMRVALPSPVSMRASPTFTFSDEGHFTVYTAGVTGTAGSITLTNPNSRMQELRILLVGLGAAGDAGWFRITDPSGWLAFDAEI